MRRIMRLPLFAAAAALAAAMPSPAFAAPAQSSGLEVLGRPISDAALGEIRGKFISPDKISYFGIQMQTSWQTPDGITTDATLLFSVNFLNGAGNPEGATPVLMISWSRDGDPSADVAGFGEAAAEGYFAIGGLGTVQGGVQSQQISGSDNIARNDMRIAIVPTSAVRQFDTDGLTEVTTGQSHSFSDGDGLSFIVANNELGLSLTGGSADQVNQSFSGNLGQAAQHILLSSSGNSIHNGMSIVIGHEQLEQTSRLSVQNAMTALKGLGF